MTESVRNILSWYESDNVGSLTNLARIMNTGTLAGTGKFVILPVDQGFEHGPARSFAPNPPAYDPRYHFRLAIESGCNAFAAPLGFLQAGAREFAGDIPLILKCSSHDLTQNETNPNQAQTATADDALRLGCAAVGYTIYPGSSHRLEMYEKVRVLTADAKAKGLAVVIWSYPRGGEISKDGETAIDICGYAAHIAAELGAHIIKVKLPTEKIEQDEARKVYEKENVPIATLPQRVKHVTDCAFGGRRIVIFSGGSFVDEATLLDDARAINEGGGFGSIMGRNTFQRPQEDAVRLLSKVMAIYKG